jgi:hypothetical protein
MLASGRNWYLIDLGPMVSCGQVADFTNVSSFLVFMVRRWPHFSWLLGIKLLAIDWPSWFAGLLDTLID